LLDGQGGDETLLGYQRYYPAYLKSLSPVKKIQGLFNSSENSGLSIGKLLQSYFYFTNAGLRIRRQEQRSGFLKTECFEMMNRALITEIADASGSISDLQILEITKSQLPHLLRYEDKNSMRFSIETRLPFLDYKLVEMALSINNEYKIRNGYSKYILRTGAKGVVPDSILWRKNKIGFEAPSRVWLSNRGFMFEAIGKSALLNSMMKKCLIIQLIKLYYGDCIIWLNGRRCSMSSSIKVCHLTSIHPPFDTRIFVKECSSLAKAGFDVSLIAVNVEEQVVNGVSILNVASIRNRQAFQNDIYHPCCFKTGFGS
jgi:hypothetical protein